jgi:hypothetical protein
MLETTGSLVLAVLGAALITLGGFVLNAGIQRLRARRTARRAGQPYWAAVCIHTDQRFLQRVFLVDSGGVRLLTMRGRQLAAWPWTAIEQAVPTGVMVTNRTTEGLLLRTADKSLPSFAFATRWGIGNSRHQAAMAANVINTRRPSS